MSRTIDGCFPAGAAHDHGFVPTAFVRPPQGGIAGLALVAIKPMQARRAANSVKYMAVPKWFELRTEIAPIPNFRARSIAIFIAAFATTWPIAPPPSIRAMAPPSRTNDGLALELT